MEVTTKQLRIEPGRIISQVDTVHEITVTYRGKPRAKIVPIGSSGDAAKGKKLYSLGIDMSGFTFNRDEINER